MSTNSVGMDSGISMDSRRSARDNKMKMFSTAFINWTDKLKVMTDGNEDNLSASTDDLETMSVKTDLSSDDDFEHLMFEDKEAPAFCHDVFETTSTTDTFSDLADDSSSVYAESSSTRGKEIVSWSWNFSSFFFSLFFSFLFLFCCCLGWDVGWFFWS